MASPIVFNNPASLKPSKGRSWKRARRIEIVARMEAAFISDQEIANHLGLTVAAIQAIKRSPEFLAKRLTLSTNQLSVYDNHLLDDETFRQESLSELNLMALNAVKGILVDKSHPAYAKVALDLMDRNPATAKITKTQHSVTTKPDFSTENKRAKELLGMLETAPAEVIDASPVTNSIGVIDFGPSHDLEPQPEPEDFIQ